MKVWATQQAAARRNQATRFSVVPQASCTSYLMLLQSEDIPLQYLVAHAGGGTIYLVSSSRYDLQSRRDLIVHAFVVWWAEFQAVSIL
jgi:hypothetical protein